MAKAILEFDLNDHDDAMEFKRCTQSLDMALAIWEILYNTRKQLHNEAEFEKDGANSLDVFDGIDMVYDRIFDIMNQKGINIDDLIY
jgi:hypothetical protein